MAVETVLTDTEPFLATYNQVGLKSEHSSWATARSGSGASFDIYGRETTSGCGSLYDTNGLPVYIFYRTFLVFNTADVSDLGAVTGITITLPVRLTPKTGFDSTADAYLVLKDDPEGQWDNPTNIPDANEATWTDIDNGTQMATGPVQLTDTSDAVFTLTSAARTLVTDAITAGKNMSFAIVSKQDYNNSMSPSTAGDGYGPENPPVRYACFIDFGGGGDLKMEITHQSGTPEVTAPTPDNLDIDIPGLVAGMQVAFACGGSWVTSVADDDTWNDLVAIYNANNGTSHTFATLYDPTVKIKVRYPGGVEADNQIIEVPKPGPPRGVIFECEGANAGTLYGSTTAMEYSTDGESSWSDVTGNDMDMSALDLSGVEFIYIRYKVTSTFLASDSTKVSRCGFNQNERPAAPIDCTLTVDTVNADGSIATLSITTAGVFYTDGIYEPVGGTGVFSVIEVDTLLGSVTTIVAIHIGGFNYTAGDVLTLPKSSTDL